MGVAPPFAMTVLDFSRIEAGMSLPETSSRAAGRLSDDITLKNDAELSAGAAGGRGASGFRGSAAVVMEKRVCCIKHIKLYQWRSR